MPIGRLSTWRGMMRQRLSVQPPSGKDGYGQRTYGSAVSYRCRLVGKRRQVLDVQGREVTSMWTAYLYSADVIDPESLVTLSTGDVGSTESFAVNPPIKSVSMFPDESGHHHTVLFL